MTREVRGMLMGVCIVILAIAAWLLKEKPAGVPGGTASTTTASDRK